MTASPFGAVRADLIEIEPAATQPVYFRSRAHAVRKPAVSAPLPGRVQNGLGFPHLARVTSVATSGMFYDRRTRDKVRFSSPPAWHPIGPRLCRQWNGHGKSNFHRPRSYCIVTITIDRLNRICVIVFGTRNVFQTGTPVADDGTAEFTSAEYDYTDK